MSVNTIKSEQFELQRLLSIMSQLRDPVKGCSWDKEQTFDSISSHTLEEAYEVLDAIERRDFENLKQELGDLLFQVIFYAHLAQEQSLFNFNNICEAVSTKLERRHPHIFDENSNFTLTDGHWEKVKHEERVRENKLSVLDDIPLSMPALMRAQKIQERCATVGFDWKTLEPVLEKVHEEIDEAMYEASQDNIDDRKLEEELGDLLFSVVNLTRHFGFKAEHALQAANRKFEQRFRSVEKYVSASGQSMDNVSLDELESIWQQVKNKNTKE